MHIIVILHKFKTELIILRQKFCQRRNMKRKLIWDNAKRGYHTPNQEYLYIALALLAVAAVLVVVWVI